MYVGDFPSLAEAVGRALTGETDTLCEGFQGEQGMVYLTWSRRSPVATVDGECTAGDLRRLAELLETDSQRGAGPGQ